MTQSFLANIADARARTLKNLIETLTTLNVVMWVKPTYSPFIDAALMDLVTAADVLIRVAQQSELPSRCPICDTGVGLVWSGPLGPESRPVLLRCRSEPPCGWELPVPESAVEGL